jgi:hypothetical protein
MKSHKKYKIDKWEQIRVLIFLLILVYLIVFIVMKEVM